MSTIPELTFVGVKANNTRRSMNSERVLHKSWIDINQESLF